MELSTILNISCRLLLMENLQKHGSSGLKLNPKWWSFRFDVLSSRVLARVVLLQMFVELSA